MTKQPFRALVSALIGAAFVALAPTAQAADTTVLKLSHQFPASTGADGDFRDQLARKFAAEVEQKTGGSLKIEVYPGSSLMKTKSQFSALRKGTLDMSVLPLAYGGGEVPEVTLTLMPALVHSYEQGLRWKTAPIGKELDRILESKGIKIVTWVWQAGGIASRDKPILVPDDMKGLKVRGGARTMDQMINGAGGSATSLPSSEIYSAMSTGVLDAALTSSTSLISYRLNEVAKAVTTARGKTFWFMFEPVLISMDAWNRLTPEQQKVVMEVGASLEPFAVEGAKRDDQRLAEVYAAGGAKVVDMDDAAFAKWVAIAKETSYKEFAKDVNNGQALIDMAQAVK
ncbi:C4-dicarboxylate ABC transporter [Nitrogeniibacter mangrovi]|uniref:C4-dicarboxylate ABC transporter n=1 Tax=Nitrogeniibacter mangrovi TaxID=2016596 RepID=A0A6C1BA42_9RHOO|nr:TRAP transporter substrate-binding protein DctP [Nitrogeniibacter mangrovi]QID19558.1 C4-dicarboxylate ABC transporter [Nitrogeniibacter mangrovi]